MRGYSTILHDSVQYMSRYLNSLQLGCGDCMEYLKFYSSINCPPRMAAGKMGSYDLWPWS